MPKIIKTITTDAPLETVFAYLADFENATEWDPGTKSSVARDEDGPKLGQVYDLVVTWGSRELPMVYTTTRLLKNDVVVFEGDGSTTTAVDTLTFTRDGDGTALRYEADITLKWPFKLAEPFLGSKFDDLGAKAEARLIEVLGGLVDAGR